MELRKRREMNRLVRQFQEKNKKKINLSPKNTESKEGVEGYVDWAKYEEKESDWGSRGNENIKKRPLRHEMSKGKTG